MHGRQGKCGVLRVTAQVGRRDACVRTRRGAACTQTRWMAWARDQVGLAKLAPWCWGHVWALLMYELRHTRKAPVARVLCMRHQVGLRGSMGWPSYFLSRIGEACGVGRVHGAGRQACREELASVTGASSVHAGGVSRECWGEGQLGLALSSARYRWT